MMSIRGESAISLPFALACSSGSTMMESASPSSYGTYEDNAWFDINHDN